MLGAHNYHDVVAKAKSSYIYAPSLTAYNYHVVAAKANHHRFMHKASLQRTTHYAKAVLISFHSV